MNESSFWYKYFIARMDNPIDWKEFDKLISKIGSLGVEYQDFGRRGRCYRIPIISAVAAGIQSALDESWKNVYPLSALPACLQVPWEKVEKEPFIPPEKHLSRMSAELKANGHYTDPYGVEWSNGDGIINYWEKVHGKEKQISGVGAG